MRKARLVDCVAQLKEKARNYKEREKDDKWEEQYVEFKKCMEMPAVGSTLYNWTRRLSNGHLDAMIEKEIAENEGSTLWMDRKARLVDCVAQLKGAKKDDKWEEQYVEFKTCVENAVGSKLYNWKQNWLNKADAMIEKEITENEGSTENEESSVWTDMNARLLRCIAQKEGML